MADVFEVLSKDHDELRRILTRLHIGPTAQTGATGNQLVARKKLTDQLVTAEQQHEALEAEFFWPAVRDHDPAAAQLADQAIGQVAEISQALTALEHLDTGATEFEPLLTEVISDGLDHIDFEEQQVWPVLRQVFSAAEVTQLGHQIAQGKAVRA